MTSAKRLPASLWRFCVAVARDLREGHAGLYASSLVYTTLLSLAPLLAVCFSVLKGLGVHNMIAPFLRNFLLPLGAHGTDIADRIVGFVDNVNVGALGSVGVAFLLYGVLSLMHKTEAAFNDIWRVTRPRSFLVRVRDYSVFLLVGPLLLFLSASLAVSFHFAPFLQLWLGAGLLKAASDSILGLLPFLLLATALTVLYLVIPNTRVRVGPALAAGVATALLWKLLGGVFGGFIAGSSSTAAIYSVFAGLVVFMIWLYAVWFVVLAGGVAAYYLQNPSNQPLSRHVRNLSLRVKEKLALLVCAEVGARFVSAGAPADVSGLAGKLRVPALAVDDVVDDLVSVRILARTGQGGRCFIPACPFDTTTVADMLRRLRAADEEGSVSFGCLPSPACVEDVMQRLEAAATGAADMPLKQLSQEGGQP